MIEGVISWHGMKDTGMVPDRCDFGPHNFDFSDSLVAQKIFRIALSISVKTNAIGIFIEIA